METVFGWSPFFFVILRPQILARIYISNSQIINT